MKVIYRTMSIACLVVAGLAFTGIVEANNVSFGFANIALCSCAWALSDRKRCCNGTCKD